MAGDIQNLRLILQAARALTVAGQAPFTRISAYQWIWRRYPRARHGRPSLDPTFQGMTRDSTGADLCLTSPSLVEPGVSSCGRIVAVHLNIARKEIQSVSAELTVAVISAAMALLSIFLSANATKATAVLQTRLQRATRPGRPPRLP
jgi:hypothetical protein